MDTTNESPHLLLITYCRTNVSFNTNIQKIRFRKKRPKKSKPVLYFTYVTQSIISLFQHGYNKYG